MLQLQVAQSRSACSLYCRATSGGASRVPCKSTAPFISQPCSRSFMFGIVVSTRGGLVALLSQTRACNSPEGQTKLNVWRTQSRSVRETSCSRRAHSRACPDNQSPGASDSCVHVMGLCTRGWVRSAWAHEVLGQARPAGSDRIFVFCQERAAAEKGAVRTR